jgi:CO/xanthine dehydrogenase FAD-binding subunit
VWDFPLLNVAAAMAVSGDRIVRIRIAVNGAAARPLRLKGGGRPSSRQAAELGNR